VTGGAPIQLKLCAAVIAAELAVEAIAGVARHRVTPVLVFVVVLRVVFLRLLFRRGAGAAFGTLVFQLSAAFLWLFSDGSAALRFPLAASAVAGLALLAASLHWFPSPQLPPVRPS